MNQTELNKYRAVLEAKQTELSAGLRNREDIAIEKTPDALDEVQLAGERELAIRNLDRESNLLRNVKGALGRIADGSYGVCLHCEEDIKPKRLDAVPWTKYCIRCQEASDRHEFVSRYRRGHGRAAAQRGLRIFEGRGRGGSPAPFVYSKRWNSFAALVARGYGVRAWGFSGVGPWPAVPPRRVGILAGAFNPVTVAHLALARAALSHWAKRRAD
jgi:DnaK suppressor protein